eukprot:EG_transcript_13711
MPATRQTAEQSEGDRHTGSAVSRDTRVWNSEGREERGGGRRGGEARRATNCAKGGPFVGGGGGNHWKPRGGCGGKAHHCTTEVGGLTTSLRTRAVVSKRAGCPECSTQRPDGSVGSASAAPPGHPQGPSVEHRTPEAWQGIRGTKPGDPSAQTPQRGFRAAGGSSGGRPETLKLAAWVWHAWVREAYQTVGAGGGLQVRQRPSDDSPFLLAVELTSASDGGRHTKLAGNTHKPQQSFRGGMTCAGWRRNGRSPAAGKRRGGTGPWMDGQGPMAAGRGGRQAEGSRQAGRQRNKRSAATR